MSSIKLIDLHSMISAAISSITSSVSTLLKIIAQQAFTKYKNLVLGTPSPAIGSYITINN